MPSVCQWFPQPVPLPTQQTCVKSIKGITCMKQITPISLRALVRISLGFVLLLGLCVMMSMQAPFAHAQTTITVSTCDESHLDAAISQANTDNASDTVNFSCSGDITLTSTLTISGNMTLDGSGQTVTLDGNNAVQVLLVNPNVTFGLKNLTVADGLNSTNVGRSGGLNNNFGTVTITNSTFVNNSAPNGGYGGGIFNAGSIIITDSTFTNNSAAYGGAITATGGMTLVDSTVVGNIATANGGGIWTNTTVGIALSTFAYNKATGNGGGIYNGSTVDSNGNIVAENTAGTGNNCFGSLTDGGYNLESATDCGFTGTGSVQNTNPQLASALANNGGLTQTLALQQGSPAIDVIPLAKCPPTDQRGNTRPDDASETSCDIGAYESSYSASMLTVTGTTINATEGKAFTGVIATGTANGTTNPLSASIAWGDGGTSTASITPTSGSYSVSGTHTYAEEGLYTINITVKDGSGLQASTTSSAHVSDAKLTLANFAAGSIGHLKAGLAATFTDADPTGQVSDYQATITWGDGTTSTVTVVKNSLGKGFALAGTHSYARKGTYTITLTVSDTGGSKVTKAVKVTVK